jgi:hypothetical protein
MIWSPRAKAEGGSVPDAGVVELVDTPDLGSGGESFGGSSPSTRTSTPVLRIEFHGVGRDAPRPA